MVCLCCSVRVPWHQSPAFQLLYRLWSGCVVVREYYDTSLQPFTDYKYQVEAENSAGSVLSPAVTLRTPAGSPSGDLQLYVTGITATSASFSWNQPLEANGVIQKYTLTSRTLEPGKPQEKHYEGLNRGVVLTNLRPFEYYIFTLTACTLGGCLSSNDVKAEMRSAPPQGQGPVTIVPFNETVLNVSWLPPSQANGLYHRYT